VRLILAIAAVLAGAGVYLRVCYRRWRQATERERFDLAVKAATIPQHMSPASKQKLELLRSPWWAVWKWFPDYWRRPPPPDGS
jgi:hypothetical protein